MRKDTLHLRAWSGPLTFAAFFAVAITGLLLFFGMKGGPQQVIHEWLSVLLVVGAVGHLIVNWRPFKAYFRKPLAVSIMALALLCCIPLARAAYSGPHARGQSRLAAMRSMQAAMENAPLGTAAALTKRSPESLISTLKAKGLQASSADQTLTEIAAASGTGVDQILNAVFSGTNHEPAAPSHPRRQQLQP